MLNRFAAVLGVVLAVSGCRNIEPAPPPEAPRVTSFTASKTRIAPGEEVTLTYATTLATKVELTDDSGREVALTGDAAGGTATVAPTRSSFYVLRATGVGGRDTAFVQIAVNEPLKDLFLLAVPGTISSGEQAQLLWGAPGASSVTLKVGTAAAQPLTGTTGTVTVSPSITEEYLLTAQGAPGTPPLTALTRIAVRPVMPEADLEAGEGFLAGKTLRFTWKTAGAARVTITERTFGQLQVVTDAAAVAQGTFDYVLPATLPNGIAVADGTPLQFTVSASAGDETISKTFEAVVGDLPSITQLTAPEFATTGETFTISWRTLNATSVTVSAGGLPIWQSLPSEQARVARGSLTLPTPTAATEYTLIAGSDRGAAARQSFNVRPVALPAINTFTLTPTINAYGDPATARWTTTSAARVVLRIENGLTLGVIETPSQVASGSFAITPASSLRVTLEASNAAGAVVSQTRAVSFTSGAATITPSPALRGSSVTLDWNLAPAATEVVGLPTTVPAVINASASFIDLEALPAAQPLTFVDPTSGAEALPLPAGFAFTLLGETQRELFVAVDGFISVARPTSGTANSDFTASGNSSPTMLAPFWDDLTLASTSKVLTHLSSTSRGERFLIVQWNKVQLAGDPTSELTFQAHLYESGQVAFVYKTTTGALNGATIGVKVTSWPYAHVYSFNSATTQAAAGLELNYFTGGPAAGTLTYTASRSTRLDFVGRTATGLVPASVDVRTFASGDFTITEVMPVPELSVAANGQWLEVRNNADASVDFGGLLVRSNGSATVDGGYLILENTVVPPYGYLVLGQSTDNGLNGGARVQQAWADVPLTVPGNVSVGLVGAALATFSWDAGAAWDAGIAPTSLAVAEDILVPSGTSTLCTRNRTVTFGSNGAFGTPGARNENCAPYEISVIPGNFQLSPTGSTIFTSLSSDDDYGASTLPVPFTYFGTAYTAFSLSTNGLMTLGSPLTTSYSGNGTTIATTAPNGVLAVFWDDLERQAGRNAMWRMTDRTIVSWESYAIYNTTSASTNINAQVHLLDTGVIEFHYGALATSLTDAAVLNSIAGGSATAWLENPSGTLAIPWSINTPGRIKPNSGLRFTPVP